MSRLAIRTRDLGKQYLVRRPEESDSIRTHLAQGVARLWRGRSAPRQRIWALRHLSIEIAEHEAIGVVGSNGAGKTTLARLFGKITRPTCGTVELWGRVASLLDVGLGFHPDLTGRENLYLGGAMLGMVPAQVRRRFDDIVAFAGIERHLEAPLKTFSTGMNLRLAFALASHIDCDILVVDEVLSVGDAGFQRRCLDRLRQFAREGRTILVISHQLDVLRELCGRTLHLDRGRLVEFGPTREVLDRYLAVAHVAGEESGAAESEPLAVIAPR